MTARDQAVAYVKRLTASDSSPEHVRSICRLALVKFPECGLSADQLKALVRPPVMCGFGAIERVVCS